MKLFQSLSLKALFITLISITLVSIVAVSITFIFISPSKRSSGPSNAEVQAAATQELRQVDQHLTPLGLKWTDIFDTKVKLINKAKQNDGLWLVETEATISVKQDINNLPLEAQAFLFVVTGGKVNKGDILGGGPITSQIYMIKGNKGWIAKRDK